MQFKQIADKLRKDNPGSYHFSRDASYELARNDKYSAEYGQEMWDEFYAELEQEYLDTKESSNGR